MTAEKRDGVRAVMGNSFPAGNNPRIEFIANVYSVMWSCTTLFFPCSYNSGNIVARSEQRACTPESLNASKTIVFNFPSESKEYT